MKLKFQAVAIILAGLSSHAFAQASGVPAAAAKTVTAKAAAKKMQPVYTVSQYSPERDAAQDLAATIMRAKAERKRILLEVGGNW